MIARELDPMSEADRKAFATIWKQSKEAGNPDGAIRLIQEPNGAMLCFDEQGEVCGAITFSKLHRVHAFGIGWVCIPVRHKRYGEIFNTMFDEVYRLAGEDNIFMELDAADKMNIQLAGQRSFRKVPLDYMALPMPGIPQDNKVLLFVRSRGPVDNYVQFLKAWFTYAYQLPNIEFDPRFQQLASQAAKLEHKF